MFNGIRTSISHVVTTVSQRLHVPKVVSIGILGLVAAGVPAGGYFLMSHSDDSLHTQFWVDDEAECRNYVKEAVEAQDEQGEILIPEITSGHYKTGYVATQEWPIESARANSNFADVCSFYDRGGGHRDEYGFERVGDYYIVAVCFAPFNAHTGDHITFYFDDGTSIETIVGDEKACQDIFKDPAHFDDPPQVDVWDSNLLVNGWGHIDPRDDPNSVAVLEFWGDNRIESAMEPLRKSTGGSFQRVTSATNHGMVSGFTSGVVEGASASQTNVKQASDRGAIDECRTNAPYDNGTLAKAAVSFAWSSGLNGCNSNPTSLYQEVINATTANPVHGATCRSDGKCCYCTIRAAFMWSGADINFPQANYESADKYFSMHPELYQRVEGAQNVQLDASREWADEHGLQPGDFAITTPETSREYSRATGHGDGPNAGHVTMYVSHEIAQEVYDNFIQGRTGDGDSGERPNTEYVQSSYKQIVATCLDYSDFDTVRRYNFWRYIGPYPDRDEMKDVGVSANLKYTPVSGTKCECGEKECEPNIGEELSYLAVQCAVWCSNGAYPWNDVAVFSPHDGNGACPWYNPYTDNHRSSGKWSDEEPELWLEAVSVDAGIYRQATAEEAANMRNVSKVFNEVALHGENSFNSAIGSCNQAVCGLAAAVVDMDMTPHRAASGNPGFMKYYLEHNRQCWKQVNATSVDDLLPGDILVVANLTVDVGTGSDGLPNFDDAGETGWNGCHTMMFVDRKMAEQRFPEIKSWSSKGVVYQAGYSHDHGRYPGLNPIDGIGDYSVFRPIRHNDNSKFEDVDYKSCIPSWHLKSSCPDEEEEDVANTSYGDVVAKAREFLGRPYTCDHDYKNPNLASTDCSGLILWAYYQALGVDIPALGGGGCTTEFIANRNGSVWQEVSQAQLVPGDVIVMYSGAGVSGYHTVLYAGVNGSGVQYCIHEDGTACNEISLADVLGWSKDPSQLHFLHYRG